jgi:hypothetical protein
MSYLDVPRLHFYGTFTADPSTINNDPTNYDPGNWRKPDLSWNPYGSHAWSIQGEIKSYVDQNGCYVYCSEDNLIGATIHNITTLPAKLVDLDTDAQTRTRLYGLNLEIALPGSSGSVLLQGGFLDTASLLNLWFARVPSIQFDPAAGAAWQSVLQDLKWGDVSALPPLKQLNQVSPDSLSIRLSVYAFDDSPSSPTFRQGKIVGTIGPRAAGEPKHLVAGRFLSPPANSKMWDAPAKVDESNKRLTIDLGNSIPEQAVGGPSLDFGDMQAAILTSSGPVCLGKIDYSQGQYQLTAGVVQIDDLTGEQIKQLTDSPLGILVSKGGGTYVGEDTLIALQENADGIHIQPDGATIILNPGDKADVDLYVTEFGNPKAGYKVPLQLVPQSGPINNEPASGISFPAETAPTDVNGRTRIPLLANDPIPKPVRRRFIGGQLYYIGGAWMSHADQFLGSPLIVKVFNAMQEIPNPTWKDVQPILAQYYTLYAYMASIVDLSNYEAVKARKDAIKSVISLPVSDPRYMPVSRELSRDEQTLILRWIKSGAPA